MNGGNLISQQNSFASNCGLILSLVDRRRPEAHLYGQITCYNDFCQTHGGQFNNEKTKWIHNGQVQFAQMGAHRLPRSRNPFLFATSLACEGPWWPEVTRIRPIFGKKCYAALQC